MSSQKLYNSKRNGYYVVKEEDEKKKLEIDKIHFQDGCRLDETKTH